MSDLAINKVTRPRSTHSLSKSSMYFTLRSRDLLAAVLFRSLRLSSLLTVMSSVALTVAAAFAAAFFDPLLLAGLVGSLVSSSSAAKSGCSSMPWSMSWGTIVRLDLPDLRLFSGC